MHKIILTLILLFSTLYSEPITEYLNTDIHHKKTKKSQFDAAFLIRLQPHEDLEELKNTFSQYGIPLTEFDKFKKIPDHILTGFCSNTISPHLLTQILSHLSIYKYCIKNKIKTALIVENQAYVTQNPQLLNQIIKTVDKSHKRWDILYTDIDYHHPTNGQLNIPNISHITKNKKLLDKHHSKVYVRYGNVSYVISSSGMKKILKYFEENWPDLPYDQALFTIPKLKQFSTNIDIITNRYVVAPEEKSESPSQALYETGKEFNKMAEA